jgi:hypothetical protein
LIPFPDYPSYFSPSDSFCQLAGQKFDNHADYLGFFVRFAADKYEITDQRNKSGKQ